MDNKELESFRIDFLRALGIIFMTLPHANPPKIIFQLRNFDVILLVLISGATFSLKYDDSVIKPLPYLRNRIVRLLVPSYIFLLFFFTCAYVACYFLHIHPFPYGKSYIIQSFVLARVGGINYMWIIAVFLMVAIITPLIAHFNRAVKKNFVYFFIVYSLLLLHEILFKLLLKDIRTQGYFSNNYLFYIIPYACIFAIGARLNKFSINNIALTAAVIMILFCLSAVILSLTHGRFVWTQGCKYPPRLYYVSYGLSASLCIYALTLKITRFPYYVKKVMIFVSRGSLWIYLWQILVMFVLKSTFAKFSTIMNNFIIAWVLIILLSTAITLLQKKIISSFVSSPIPNPKIKNFLNIAFL